MWIHSIYNSEYIVYTILKTQFKQENKQCSNFILSVGKGKKSGKVQTLFQSFDLLLCILVYEEPKVQKASQILFCLKSKTIEDFKVEIIL